MSVPQRPRDIQLANIIDKLAEFVARNGPEFEHQTKIKQQSNIKFSFLQNGSEFFQYYQYKLMEARRSLIGMPLQPQNILQQQQQQNIWSLGSNQPQNVVNFLPQIETINEQQMKLREQISISEKNLSAQHQVLLQQQKSQIDDAIAKAQTEHITRCAQENQISLSELEEVLQPIIESCTKDSIANGKLWILQQTSNSAKSQIISQFILKNMRKNADDLKNALESVVIVMFCDATISANEDQADKLNKLLTLWSSKANFFDSCAISKLQSPPSSLQEYHNTLLSQYASVITPLSQATKSKFDNYQQQHQAFIKHAANQIALLETEKLKLEQQQTSQPPPSLIQELTQNPAQSILNNVNLRQNQNRNDVNIMQSMFGNQNYQNFPIQHQPPPQMIHQQQQQQQQQDINKFMTFNLPPPTFPIPDLSRPPPILPSHSFDPAENSPPQAETIEEPDPQPFFLLPAGLMVPLIGLESYNYRGLETDCVKRLPPLAPTEKQLSAIEAFYSAPSHERPRNTEGWEKLGLYEYFKVKNAVKKQKEEEIAKGVRLKSKSLSPIPESLMKPIKRQKKRIYRSKSPEIRPSKSKSRSISPRPTELRPTVTQPVVRNRSRKRSRSPSPTPYRNFNRDTRIDRRKRSVTPPSFMGAAKVASEFIPELNKGHQMLKKLGWTSGGLGAGKNQGIAEPISGGELRDRSDLYKGVGMNTTNDPYENFRKNRSNNFIVRMKSRGEDKN